MLMRDAAQLIARHFQEELSLAQGDLRERSTGNISARLIRPSLLCAELVLPSVQRPVQHSARGAASARPSVPATSGSANPRREFHRRQPAPPMRGTKHHIELADQLAWAWVISCEWIPTQLHAMFWQILCQRWNVCRGGTECRLLHCWSKDFTSLRTDCRCSVGVLSTGRPSVAVAVVASLARISGRNPE